MMSIQHCPHRQCTWDCHETAVLTLETGAIRRLDGCRHSQMLYACWGRGGALFGSKGKHRHQRRGRFGPFFKDSTCLAADVQLSCAPLPHCTNCWYRRSRSFCDTSVKVWSNDSWWHFLTRWSVSKMWGDVSVNCVLQRKKKQKTKKASQEKPTTDHYSMKL